MTGRYGRDTYTGSVRCESSVKCLNADDVPNFCNLAVSRRVSNSKKDQEADTIPQVLDVWRRHAKCAAAAP